MAYSWRTLRDGRVEIAGVGVTSLRGAEATRMDRDVLGRWRPLIAAQARRTGLLPSWIAAVIAAESWGNPRAVSPAGAVGLMQIMPSWWRGHTKEEVQDPELNATIGCDLLAAIRRTQPQLPIVASVYNCGSDDAKNTPRRNASLPWGLCEDVIRTSSGIVSSDYISNVVAGNNYAIERGRLRSASSGAFPVLFVAALAVWGLA